MVIELGYDWETSNDWEKVVCEPVIQGHLAPRQARALLEHATRLMSMPGGSFDRILLAMSLAIDLPGYQAAFPDN
ncbi:MAG: hypothetical protein L0332_30425 [Chloroflexi bacterium]|nr:hypothetical protein [Chloroflexota bacterium]